MIKHNRADMTLGVYRGELDNVLIPTYSDLADDLTVMMLKQWQPHWHGEPSLAGQQVLWPRGWALV